MTDTEDRSHQTVRGVKVPSLGLGTWRLSGSSCTTAVELALDVGYRHIDTARMYGNEAEVGAGIKNSGLAREDLFVTTKLWTDTFTHDRAKAAGRDSVEKLGTEYVDLLLMHWPNPDVPVEETVTAMRELQDEGLVRHIGVSNFSGVQMEEAARYGGIFCNQVRYNTEENRSGLLEQAREMNYLVTAYTPISKGRTEDDATLREIASGYGKSPTQVALRWLVQQEKVSAIPKATGRAHLEENLDIFDFRLTDEEMRSIFALAG
ncbi:aldo/keto reductase [Rubrobacter indicoceani]|uniref:aldo/keto reductase n=1 Tax=Rubrobacter indicoceani TaxID=2051957 RepID=UPI000E5AA206|nr:aldo/keto reductase [Rubrobacter indicoceani]